MPWREICCVDQSVPFIAAGLKSLSPVAPRTGTKLRGVDS